VLELEAGEPFPGAGTERVIWMRDATGHPLVHLTLPGATFRKHRAAAGFRVGTERDLAGTQLSRALTVHPTGAAAGGMAAMRLAFAC
jgi:hypothetical protein